MNWRRVSFWRCGEEVVQRVDWQSIIIVVCSRRSGRRKYLERSDSKFTFQNKPSAVHYRQTFGPRRRTILSHELGRCSSSGSPAFVSWPISSSFCPGSIAMHEFSEKYGQCECKAEDGGLKQSFWEASFSCAKRAEARMPTLAPPAVCGLASTSVVQYDL